jgi:hypothetical protein
MYYNHRLSRIAHPRGTLVAMILLTVVFLGFGMWAEAHHVPAVVNGESSGAELLPASFAALFNH